MTVDDSGNIYVTDTVENVIRKITPAGEMITIAGTDSFLRGGSADGTGTDAQFTGPTGIVMDKTGNLYVADTGNHTIRKITPANVVTTIAGMAPVLGSMDGRGIAAQFSHPISLAADNTGAIYVLDSGNKAIRKVTPAGVVSTLTAGADQLGLVDSKGAPAQLRSPRGLTTDSAGNVYVSDLSDPYITNIAVRKITPQGVITTLTDAACDSGGASMGYYNLFALATDGANNIFVAADMSIVKVTPTGTVTSIPATLSTPYIASDEFSFSGLAVDSTGNIYIADHNNHTIRKITSMGAVTTFAGGFGESGSNDGIGSEARFNSPSAVALDKAGNIYVADTGNHTIRKITPDRVVTTIVGVPGQRGNILGPLPGSLSAPTGISIDTNGTLYVLTENGIVKVLLPGLIQ